MFTCLCVFFGRCKDVKSQHIPVNGTNGNGHHCCSAKPKSLVHVSTSANGGASYVTLDIKEFRQAASDERDQVVSEFFRETFSLEDNRPRHVMGIVRGAAKDLPDPLRQLAKHHPHSTGQVRDMLSKAVETTTIAEYYDLIQENLVGNCFRAGPLNSMSLVGTVSEEVGGHFEDILSKLEEILFLRMAMPWGCLSSLKLSCPTESNDGPILWVRPGEQMVSAAEPAAKRAR